jgi:hypothetical protein
MTSSDKLKKLMDALLSPKNAERLTQVFYDAAKIVYERQKRLKKPQLKMKEVSSALVLADIVQSQSYHCEAVGKLAENFGPVFAEATALDYYEQKVIGQVQDIHGRTISIDEQGMKSLYKDPVSGEHQVSSENYEQVRGKRLAWIHPTLKNSNAIYVSEEMVDGTFRRTFLYTAIVSIPLDPKPAVEYYVVVVREDKNGNLRFVTQYSMVKKNRFLQIISLCYLYAKDK